VRGVRLLALDYGTKNVGLACCDELGIAVRPLPSIERRGRRELLRRIQALAAEIQAGLIIVGLPLNMDGSSGPAGERVLRFAQELESEAGFPVRTVDERLSTEEAREIWRSMPERKRRKYRTIDSLAAALILERYLAEQAA